MFWTAAGAADLAATWPVPGGKEDRKAESGTDTQQGVGAAAGGPYHRRGWWKCPKDSNGCFYDHVWGAMGFEFRNNGYEENQKGASFLHRGQMQESQGGWRWGEGAGSGERP